MSRYKRRLCADATCPVCGLDQETLLHLLRDCPMTHNLWKLFVPQRLWHKFNTLNLDHWFRWNISCGGRSKQAEEWSQTFVILCWWLWRRRNSLVFEGKQISNNNIQNSVSALRDSLQDARSRLGNLKGKQSKSDHGAKWTAPPPGWVKINTDGAFSHLSVGVASGGALRDEHSNFLQGFLFKGVEGDSLTAELWGCLHGLKLVWDMGYRQIILESDAAEAVELIQREPMELHEDRNLIAEIHCLLQRDWTVVVNHIGRWANTVADHLAKASLSVMPGLHIFSSTDIELQRLLDEDMS